MSEAPAFSVIVPTYNAISTVAATIRSVLAQTEVDFELIVVDDGSSDGTPELVETTAAGDPRLRLVRQANQGTPGARNTGIGLARGRFVSLLDNDDLWLPRFLESTREALDASPGAGLAYTDVWMLDGATGRFHRKSGLMHYGIDSTEMSAEELWLQLLQINFITACTVTMRREAIERVGVFDTAVRGSDDYDLWLRIAAAGFGAVCPPGRLALLRDRPDSQSKDRLMMAQNLRAVLAKAGAELADSSPAKTTVERRLKALDTAIGGFRGERGTGSLAFRARHRLAELKTRLRRPIDLRRTPPEEILAAFPDLEAIR